MTMTDRLIAYFTAKLEARRGLLDAVPNPRTVNLQARLNGAGVPREFRLQLEDVEDEGDRKR